MKSILIALIASVILSACGSLPPPPDSELCAMIWGGDLSTSYGYCRKVISNTFTRRVPIEQMIKEGWLSTTVNTRTEQEIYLKQVEEKAKERCR